MRAPRRRLAWSVGLVALWVGLTAGSSFAQPPAPPAEPPATEAAPEGLADKVRVLEESNRRLVEQMERLERLERLGGLSPATDPRPDPDPETAVSPVPDYTEGRFAPFASTPSAPSTPATRAPLSATFGPGFRLRSEDNRFELQIHYESQIEGRVWDPNGREVANDGFFLPRQRFFLSGHITQPVEYEIAINRGLNNINLLNALLNFHFDDRLEVRIGRFMTPVLYDQYAISNYWLLTPERSLFTTNLGLNRQVGAMAWGYLLDKRLDYAVGVFNGSRNSFERLGGSVDGTAFLNFRPFQNAEGLPWLHALNLGTSAGFGRREQDPVPLAFRVGGGGPDANIAPPATTPFLILNPGTVERGERLIGSVHAAYFYQGLSLIGEWQYGYGGYASAARPVPVTVPFSGYYASAGYFLTGETVERRTRVRPLRPVFPTSDSEQRGCGAWELTGRVSRLQLGDEIFTGGFADATRWSDSALTTELGANWYLNEYLKVYMFWLHAEFGQPVEYRPGKSSSTADMFWLRCQLYY